MKEFIFTWSIENFSYAWHKNGEYMRSPIFIAGPIHNSAWILLLYPRGTENSDYLSLSLYRDKDGFPQDLSINFEFSCISADNLVLHSYAASYKFRASEKYTLYAYEKFHFILRHDVFGRRRASYLPKDVLTLRCKMWIEAENGNEFDQKFGITRLTTERIITVGNINPANETKATVLIQSKCEKESLLSVHVLYFGDKIDVELKPKSVGNMKFSTLRFSFVHTRTGKTLCEHLNTFFDDIKVEKWRIPFSDKMVPTRNDDDFEFIIEFVYSTGEEIKKLEEKSLLEEIQSSRNSEYISNYINKYFPSGNVTDFPSISQEIWKLYTERCLCDIKMKTGKKSFFVHKVVLCARSPVFSAMLTGEMKEKIKGCIEIEDISDKTLEVFLNFLYTDLFEGFEWDVVIELYYAADKYQVERLKRLCCGRLMENVSSENACELLILAERHDDRELKRKLDYFVWKIEEYIIRCPAWKTFVCEQPQVAVKVMLSKYEEKGNF